MEITKIGDIICIDTIHGTLVLLEGQDCITIIAQGSEMLIDNQKTFIRLRIVIEPDPSGRGIRTKHYSHRAPEESEIQFQQVLGGGVGA